MGKNQIHLKSYIRELSWDADDPDTIYVNKCKVIVTTPYEITSLLKKKYFKVIWKKGNGTWLRIPVISIQG